MKPTTIPALSSLFAAAVLAACACAASGAEPKRFDVSEHGAVGDGQTLNSISIQATIDACAQDGGGTVVIPKGTFVSGSIFLKPGVNLELLEGAVLKGSTDIKDYPVANTRIEGHFEPWPAALVNGEQVDHLRISGPGTLDGSGPTYWQAFEDRRRADRKTTNLSVPRPRLTFIRNSADVRVSGLTFENSGFWNLHLYHCHDVTVDGCRFQSPHGVPGPAPSTDGIDVDSSQDVTISHCSFAVGDDDIALKGSKGPFAMDDKDSPPVEHIHILDCVFEAGGGIVTVGSEATVVRDVEVERCTTRKPTVLQLKLRPDTPQHYENIRMHDIAMEGSGAIFKVLPWKQYFDLKGQQPPKSFVGNITISGLKGSGGTFGRIAGNPETEFGAIALKDVDLKLKSTKIDVAGVDGLTFDNVVLNGTPTPAPTPTTAPTSAPATTAEAP